MNKWVYVQYSNGELIGKVFCSPKEMFKALQNEQWVKVISTKKIGDSIVYTIYH